MTRVGSWRGGDAERIAAKGAARSAFFIQQSAGESGARAARAASLPKLVEGTLEQNGVELLPSDHPDHGSDVWEISRTTFGSGAVEIRGFLGASSIPKRVPSDTDGPRVKCSGGSDTVRFRSSVQRSRKTLRNRCMQLAADRLLTLTKRGKFASCDELWSAFKEFSRLMQVRFGDQWRYVAAPELHSDGVTWHMHVAVKGFFWADAVRAIWYRALGGKGNERGENTPGAINLTDPRKYRRRGSTSAARVRTLASYVAKYVGKGFGVGNRSRRLFSSSSRLDPDRIERWRVREWLGVPELVVALQEQFTSIGGAEEGLAFFWSRQRPDGSLLRTGFCLSTEMRVCP